MVRDISEKLPGSTKPPRRPRVSAETRAWLAEYVPRITRSLIPSVVLAVAAGMLGWLIATAAAALDLAPLWPTALVVGFRLARWTFVAGLTIALFRYGLALERRRWRSQPSAA